MEREQYKNGDQPNSPAIAMTPKGHIKCLLLNQSMTSYSVTMVPANK